MRMTGRPRRRPVRGTDAVRAAVRPADRGGEELSARGGIDSDRKKDHMSRDSIITPIRRREEVSFGLYRDHRAAAAARALRRRRGDGIMIRQVRRRAPLPGAAPRAFYILTTAAGFEIEPAPDA